MTLTEAISMAYRLCDDDPANGRFDTALMVSIGNSVYREVCRDCMTYPVSGSITTVSGTREYAQPTGIDIIERIEWIPSGSTVGYKLLPTRYNRVADYLGYPEGYYLRGVLIGIDPIPDDAYSLTVYGYGEPTADIAGGDTLSYVPTTWQEIVAYGLAARMMEIDQGIDAQEYIKFARIFAARKLELKRFLHGGNSADQRPGVR